MPQAVFPLPFQIDHIIAEKHGGETVASNLALACPHCNLYKGPNIAGVDPASGQVVRLFHPRTDTWNQHFRWESARLLGRSPMGRVTVEVLAVNAEDFL
jgi:HNH endonuclease